MNQQIGELQHRLDQVLRLAQDPSFLALTSEQGRLLRDRAAALSQRLARSQREPLTIGLLGGTGVGKSTLLNALAGAEISSADHRRPRTDEVVVYRHEEAKSLSNEKLSGIPWKEVTHTNPSIGQILLCDLPDFDSIRIEHRQMVLDFLEHLDLLVWVASPEKYADQRFYDFLSAVPKAQTNFYFLLNKLDLFFKDAPAETGYEKIAILTQAFQKRLQETGVSEPLIFPISAKDIWDGGLSAPWNQFPSFRNHILKERRLKEVAAIKVSNLDVEVLALLDTVREGIKNLESFDAVLANAVEYIPSERGQWSEEWGRAIEGWVHRWVRNRLEGHRPEPVPLLGPGYGLAAILNRIKKGGSDEREIDSESWPEAFPDMVFSTFETHLETVAVRLDTERLHKGLPEEISMRIDAVLRRSERLADLKRAVSKTLARYMGLMPWPSFLGFRIWQGTCYGLLLAVFLMAIGAETAWKDLLHTPGATTILGLLLSIIHTLFSAKGLAALGSYVVLNLFLGFRFFRRFETLVRRTADRMVSDLRVELIAAWESEVEALMVSFEEMRNEIQKERAMISDVTGGVPG